MLEAARIVSRYLCARSVLAPDMEKIRRLVEQGDRAEALSSLDAFLNKKLNVRVFPHSDGARVMTEWAHTLDATNRRKFEEMVVDFLALRGQLMRPAPDEQAVRACLHQAQEAIPWLERMSRGAEDEFKHGPFTIILSDGAEDGLTDAIACLDAAAAKIRPKFPKVLYGKVYVRKGLRENTAGVYAEATDSIHLSLYATPDRDSIRTVIHEFGHRYHTRFMNSDQRERFIELSTVGDVHRTHFPLAERRKIVQEMMALLREHREERYPDSETFLSPRAQLWWNAYPRDEWKQKVLPHLKRFQARDDEAIEALEAALGQYQWGGNLEVVTNQQELQPLYASMYGTTSWTENFAETFLAYCFPLALPPPLKQFMDELH